MRAEGEENHDFSLPGNGDAAGGGFLASHGALQLLQAARLLELLHQTLDGFFTPLVFTFALLEAEKPLYHRRRKGQHGHLALGRRCTLPPNCPFCLFSSVCLSFSFSVCTWVFFSPCLTFLFVLSLLLALQVASSRSFCILFFACWVWCRACVCACRTQLILFLLPFFSFFLLLVIIFSTMSFSI